MLVDTGVEVTDPVGFCILVSSTGHIPNANETSKSSRPQIIRKRPSYLKDYVQ